MIGDYRHYNLFFEFIETYASVGFKGIDRQDPLILALEEMMKINNQFLSVFDMLHMKTLFVSQGCIQMLGVQPEDLTSYHFKEATYPDDLKRSELGLVKMFKTAHELFMAKKGEMVISSNLRMRSPGGNYINHLVQGYFFYNLVPVETVHMIHLNTDISWFKKMKHGFHYYAGTDLSYFKYPDEVLLMKGNVFSDREFEIIRLVHSGLNSKQIAKKLCVSTFTINTHRRNILEKTGKANISEVIYNLEEQGLL
jgi:DNA-binding CsgD family transcriptional regulator